MRFHSKCQGPKCTLLIPCKKITKTMLNMSDSHKVSGIITQRGFKRLSPRLIQTVEEAGEAALPHPWFWFFVLIFYWLCF